MNKAIPLELEAFLDSVEFFGERTPESYGRDPETFACRVADYRNGGVFVAHWAGLGEWERHPNGDEIVMLLEGEATAYLLQDGEVVEHALSAGQLIVVPENTWHRLRTDEAKVLTVTPRPTEHQVPLPE